MHFMGVLGTLMFIIGFVTFFGLGANKIYHLSQGLPAKNIALISWFYVALTTMVIGTQLFLAGFLAELVVRNAPDRNSYLIDKSIGKVKRSRETTKSKVDKVG